MSTAFTDRVTTWDQFKRQWAGPLNFLVGGAFLPFEFKLPAIDRIVDEVRRAEGASIHSGLAGDRLRPDEDAERFRALPIDRAMECQFGIAHYKLSRFDAPGKFLHGFRVSVLEPWQRALSAAGFTWERCYPIIFISGKHSATNYHMDYSHVLAWQTHGVKNFCGLKDPDRWAPRDLRVNYNASQFARPAGLTPGDAVCHEMRPGDALWNVILTPHWVDSGDSVAMSINISHGGLMLNGKLSLFEDELQAYRRERPDIAPKAFAGSYD